MAAAWERDREADALPSDTDTLLPWTPRRACLPKGRWRSATFDDISDSEGGGAPLLGLFDPSNHTTQIPESVEKTQDKGGMRGAVSPRLPTRGKNVFSAERHLGLPRGILSDVPRTTLEPDVERQSQKRNVTHDGTSRRSDTGPAYEVISTSAANSRLTTGDSYAMYYNRGQAMFVLVIPFVSAPLPYPSDLKTSQVFEKRLQASLRTLWTAETFPEFLFPPNFFARDEIANLAISVRGFKFAIRTMHRMVVEFMAHVFRDMYYHNNRYPVSENTSAKETFYRYIRDVRFTVLTHKLSTRKSPPQTGPGKYTPPQKLGNLRLDVFTKAIEGCICAREAFLKRKAAQKTDVGNHSYLDSLETSQGEDITTWLDNSDEDDDEDRKPVMPQGKQSKGERRLMRDQMLCKAMTRAVDRWIKFLRLDLGHC